MLQSITEYSRVIQNITEHYRVFLAHLLGPISGLVFIYEKVSDVPESRVWFASKNLTPRKMH